MPNGVKVLQYYGLREAFAPVITKLSYTDIRNGISGDSIGAIAHNAGNQSEIDSGAEMWAIHRADYQIVLGAAAQAKGAEIRFNGDVLCVDTETEKPTVYLKDGRTLTADLIVGADGLRSAVRASIPATTEVHPKKLLEQCWRMMVPRDKMCNNPKLNDVLTNNNEMAWVIHNQYVLSWPLPTNRPYDVVCYIVRESDVPTGLWGIRDDPANVQRGFANFCPEVVELLSHADRCVKWTLSELPPLTTCRSENGRVVLLGDDFHAMVPHAASGGNSAIEDGVVLAECLDWVRKHGRPVSDATLAYEAIRRPRVEKLQKVSQDMYGFLNAGDESAEKRDAMLRAVTVAEARKFAEPSEEERRAAPRPESDEDAVAQTPEFRQWLRGYDAVVEAMRYLAENMPELVS